MMITSPAIIFIIGFIIGYNLGRAIVCHINPLFGTLEITEKDEHTDNYKMNITAPLNDIEKQSCIRLKIEDKRSNK